MDILKYKNANWSLSGIVKNQATIFSLLQNLQNCNIRVDNLSVYGSVLPTAWSKNVFILNDIPLEKYKLSIFNLLYQYISLDICPILKFDDYKIDKKDFSDSICNDLLNFAGTHNSKVIISNDDLLDYVKSKYPRLKCIASEKKSIIEGDKINCLSYYDKLLEKYDEVILSPNYVINADLKELKGYEKVSSFHVVVDNNCIKNCSNLKNFDKCNFDFEKNCVKNNSQICFANCSKRNKKLSSLLGKTLLLSDEKIRELLDLGINNFMLQDKIANPIIFEEKLFSYVFEPVGYSQYFRCLVTKKCECENERNGKCNQI